MFIEFVAITFHTNHQDPYWLIKTVLLLYLISESQLPYHFIGGENNIYFLELFMVSVE